MPCWKRWPNRVRLALTALKYRLARWLHRWVLPSSTKAKSDTMGDWKRIQALPDDAAPRLVRPKGGPYADLINRVRLYAQNGAKALAPLLDAPAPNPNYIDEDGNKTDEHGEWVTRAGQAWQQAGDDVAALEVLRMMGYDYGDELDDDAVRAAYTAYNSPWTVKDGEVYEVVTEPSREEALQ